MYIKLCEPDFYLLRLHNYRKLSKEKKIPIKFLFVFELLSTKNLYIRNIIKTNKYNNIITEKLHCIIVLYKRFSLHKILIFI